MGTAEVVGPGTGGEQGRVVDDDVGVDAETTLTGFRATVKTESLRRLSRNLSIRGR